MELAVVASENLAGQIGGPGMTNLFDPHTPHGGCILLSDALFPTVSARTVDGVRTHIARRSTASAPNPGAALHGPTRFGRCSVEAVGLVSRASEEKS